jgi:hypothetical protein
LSAFLLIAIGVLSAVLYALVTLVRTLRRAERISFWETLLAYLAVLAPLSGVVLDSLRGIPGGRVSIVTLIAGGVFALFGLVFTVIERRRPQRLKQSRGLLALGAGVMLMAASFGVPLTAAYISVNPAAAGTGVAQVATPSGGDVTLTSDQQERFSDFFDDLFAIITGETGMTLDEVLAALDAGQTVAQMVDANGGSIDQVVEQTTRLIVDQIQIAASRGEISRVQAASGILFAESGVRLAVNNDIRSLQRMSANSGDQDVPTGTPPTENGSFFAFLTTTATPGISRDEPTPSVTVERQQGATATATPTPSRTPRPTATPTNTRVLYASPTPTPSPTLPSPCVAMLQYNVNLRAEPALDAQLLMTVSFDTVVSLFGQSEDGEWWFTEVNGQAGWLKGEFLTLTASCELLPVRKVR